VKSEKSLFKRCLSPGGGPAGSTLFGEMLVQIFQTFQFFQIKEDCIIISNFVYKIFTLTLVPTNTTNTQKEWSLCWEGPDDDMMILPYLFVFVKCILIGYVDFQ